jgi:hypothetical protein
MWLVPSAPRNRRIDAPATEVGPSRRTVDAIGLSLVAVRLAIIFSRRRVAVLDSRSGTTQTRVEGWLPGT